MKIKLLIITLCVTGVLASCKKNEAIEPTYPITGKWYVVQTRLTETPAGDATRVTYINRDHTDYILFNPDNSGEEVMTPWQGTAVKKSFTYQYSSKSLTLTYAGNVSTKVIVNVTSNSILRSQPIKDSNGKVNWNYEVDYSNK